MAQFGSAPALGAGCRRFESCHPDHFFCGCSSMVELQPSKLVTRVRFPSPAPEDLSTKESQPWFFHFKKVEGIEPMRWISVKKTCQWHVLGNRLSNLRLRGFRFAQQIWSPVTRSRKTIKPRQTVLAFLFQQRKGNRV